MWRSQPRFGVHQRSFQESCWRGCWQTWNQKASNIQEKLSQQAPSLRLTWNKKKTLFTESEFSDISPSRRRKLFNRNSNEQKQFVMTYRREKWLNVPTTIIYLLVYISQLFWSWLIEWKDLGQLHQQNHWNIH